MRRRGSMSIMVVILALSATAMITAAMALSTGSATVQRSAMQREQAVFLADSGLEHAMIRLKNDAAWRDGFSDVPLGAGTYTVTLVDDGGDIVITSVGEVGTLSNELNVRVGWE